MRTSDCKAESVRDLLLTRRGIACVLRGTTDLSLDAVRAVELDLAQLGYVISSRLHARLRSCSLDDLSEFRTTTTQALLRFIGGDRKHEPLFRKFPEEIPDDTTDLWWRRVLVHFLQAEGQPCLFCRRVGTTHVLNPCRHVVCDRCFDGTNYSACPSCEHHVDRSSPFFSPSLTLCVPFERIPFKLIDLAEDEEAEVRELFTSICLRKQGLSDSDRGALITILREYKLRVLDWLPDTIPLRENVAVVFGTLFQEYPAAEVLPTATRYLKSASDVLRFIAAFSGCDASLQRETIFKAVEREVAPSRFWGRIAEMLGAAPPGPSRKRVTIPIRVNRFKIAKMPRSLRRALLGLLDGLSPDRLVEDMLRHQSYWVWVGEFLHPGEFAKRFPNVANAFRIVRKKSADGTAAPRFHGWYSRLETAMGARNINWMLTVLLERPGEFARRFDFVVRAIGPDELAVSQVVQEFVQLIPSMATPVLLTLRSHLPLRTKPASCRVFWPKGQVATGAVAADERPPLPHHAIDSVVDAINAELLARFSKKEKFAVAVIDDELRDITVPFNERTASSSAEMLPRGSRIRVALEKTVRLFLHWCQPAENGTTTDLDLSVALYDDAWRYIGVCSYYQLRLSAGDGQLIAQSAGDLRDAPWPEGATEFVDVHSNAAFATDARYAVMVINNYAGMAFSQLERGFAGIMLREDTGGQHFDPRTVELKFAIAGENGVFIPCVLDIRDQALHWLDIQSKGEFEMNNVETSKRAITKICPQLMEYFGSGVRPSMFDLALLHAAARCDRVTLRGRVEKCYDRSPGESNIAFHQRLLAGRSPSAPQSMVPNQHAVLAFLLRGDVELPTGSFAFAVFRGLLTNTAAASDFLS